MKDSGYTRWLAGLKSGDEFVVVSAGGKRDPTVCRVARITPTQIVFDQYHRYRRSNGVYICDRKSIHRGDHIVPVETNAPGEPKVRVVVTKGIIEINSASLLRATPDVVMIHLDTVQKYPDLICWTNRGAMLGASENTLHVKDKTLACTEITVEGLEGEWAMFRETGRYHLTLAFVREQGDIDGHPDVLVHEESEGNG